MIFFRTKKVCSLVFLIFRKCQPWVVPSMFLNFYQTPGSCSYKIVLIKQRWSSHRRCSVKMLVVKISQNSEKSTCVGVSFKLSCRPVCNLIKKETPTQMFSCEFCKIFWIAFLKNTSERLLLKRVSYMKNIKLFILMENPITLQKIFAMAFSSLFN